MSYIMTMAGHEEEGYYDILTGRPRFPHQMHNIIRAERVASRKKALKEFERRAFNLPSYLPKPEGSSYQVPGLQKILQEVPKRPGYFRAPFPAVL